MISIVTGTLNRLELLKRVIQNTVEGSDLIELVLVDGGSTDGTIEYLRSLNHPQIKLIEVGGRSTYPSYMNLGIKNSKYEIIGQWNDDILICNDWYDVISQIDDSDYYMFPWSRGTLSEFETNKQSIFNKQKILFSGCMNFGLYKKDVFRKIGMYDSQFKYYWCDSDMTERCMRFGLKRKELHNIRVMEVSSMNGSDIEKRTEPDERNYGFLVLENNKMSYGRGLIPTTVEYLK